MTGVLMKATQDNKAQKQAQILFLDSRHSSAVQWDNPRKKEIRMTRFLKYGIFLFFLSIWLDLHLWFLVV